MLLVLAGIVLVIPTVLLCNNIKIIIDCNTIFIIPKNPIRILFE